MSTISVNAALIPSTVIPGSFTVKMRTYYQEKYTISVFSSSTSAQPIGTPLVVDYSSGLPTGSLPIFSRTISSGLVAGSTYYVTIQQNNLALGQTPFAGYVKLASQMSVPVLSTVTPSLITGGVIDATFPRHPQDNGTFMYKLDAYVLTTVGTSTVVSQTATGTCAEVIFSAQANSTLAKLSISSLIAGSLYQIRLKVRDSTTQKAWETHTETVLIPSITGTVILANLATPSISNYVNFASSVRTPTQIAFPSSPTVTLPYTTNTSASTSIAVTFVAPTVKAVVQQYIVYAIDFSASNPTIAELKDAQSGTFTSSFTASAFALLPQSGLVTSLRDVSIQGLDIQLSYKFAVIAKASTGYIIGGFLDASTKLTGINASSKAVFSAKSLVSAKLNVTYTFVDVTNTYTTAPVIRVTATRIGGSGSDLPITIDPVSALVIQTASQNLSFNFPVSLSGESSSLVAGSFYNFVANVSGGKVSTSTSVIGSVSASTTILAPCDIQVPTLLSIVASSTPGNLDISISDATLGLEPALALYTLSSSSSASGTFAATAVTNLKQGSNSISLPANSVGGSTVFFKVQYTSGSLNTYSTSQGPVSSAVSLIIPSALPAASNVVFTNPTAVNAVSFSFSADLTGRKKADNDVIVLAQSKYDNSKSAALVQTDAPWKLKANLPSLSSQLTSTSLDVSPNASTTNLTAQITLVTNLLPTASATLVTTFVSAAQSQVLANMNVFSAYSSLNTAVASMLSGIGSPNNADVTGLWFLKTLFTGFILSYTGVVTNNQPFYKTVAQIMSALLAANAANAFLGNNMTVYNSLLSIQNGTVAFTDPFDLLDWVKIQLNQLNPSALAQPLADFAAVRSTSNTLKSSVSASSTPLLDFRNASTALNTALPGSATPINLLQLYTDANRLLCILYNISLASTPYPSDSTWYLTPSSLPSAASLQAALKDAYTAAATTMEPSYRVQLSTAFATPQVAPVITIDSPLLIPILSYNGSDALMANGITGYSLTNYANSGFVGGNSYAVSISRIVPTGFSEVYIASNATAFTSSVKAIPSVQPAAPTNVFLTPNGENSLIVSYRASINAGANPTYTISLLNVTKSQTSTYTSTGLSCNISNLTGGNLYSAKVCVSGTVGTYSSTFVAPTVASVFTSNSSSIMAPVRVPSPVAIDPATTQNSMVSVNGVKNYTYQSFMESATALNQVSIVFRPNWSSSDLKASDLTNQMYTATFTGLINPSISTVPVQTFSYTECTQLLNGHIRFTFTIPSSWFGTITNGSGTNTLTKIIVAAIPQTALNYLAASSNLEIAATQPPLSTLPSSSIIITNLEVISGIVNYTFTVPTALVAADTASYPIDADHPLHAGTRDYWSGKQTFTLNLMNQSSPSENPVTFSTAKTTLTDGNPPTVATDSYLTSAIIGSNNVYRGSFPSSIQLTGGNTYKLSVAMDASFGNLGISPCLSDTTVTATAQLLAPQYLGVTNISNKAGAIAVSWQVPDVLNSYEIVVSSQDGSVQQSFNSIVAGQNGFLPTTGSSRSNMYSYNLFLFSSMSGINSSNPLNIDVYNMPVRQSDIQSNPSSITNIVPQALLGKAIVTSLAYDDAIPSVVFTPPSQADGTLSLPYKIIIRDTATNSDKFSSIFSSTNSTSAPVTVYILGSNGVGLLQRDQSYEVVVMANYSGSDSPMDSPVNSAYTSSWVLSLITLS